MPLFKYVSMDEDGVKITKVERVLSVEALEQKLTNDDKFLIDFKEIKSNPKSDNVSKNKKIKDQDLIEFFTFFELLLNSGISVVESLRLFCSDSRDSTLKSIVREIIVDIEDGSRVGKAFGKFAVFSGEIEHILTAGEKSGELDSTLRTLHSYLSWKDGLKKHIVSVSIYPIVVLSLVFVIIMGLFTFVIPQFEQSLTKLGGTLPATTQIIMNISNFISGHWVSIAATMIGSFIMYKVLLLVREFRDLVDIVLLKIPVIGNINSMIAQSKFVRNFHIMHTSGIPILENLELSSKLTGSSVFENKIKKARDLIKEGSPLIDAFSEQRIFSFIVLKMIEAGEKTGNLEGTLEHVNRYYNSEIPYLVDKMIKIFEFMTIIILGVVVLIVGISLFLPMLDIIGEIKK